MSPFQYLERWHMHRESIQTVIGFEHHSYHAYVILFQKGFTKVLALIWSAQLQCVSGKPHKQQKTSVGKETFHKIFILLQNHLLFSQDYWSLVSVCLPMPQDIQWAGEPEPCLKTCPDVKTPCQNIWWWPILDLNIHR